MTSTLLPALQGEPIDHTPVWFMRQAGRSLPEYRRLREGTSMLDSCRDPELVTEITLQPVRRHGVDAAIFFSDIVVPLQAAGVEVEIVGGRGPVLAAPIRTRADVEALPELEPDQIPDIAESVGRITAELGSDTPLIGFAGAPFTLASYLIEGGPSKNHEKTKSLMVADPETFSLLLSKLARISATFIDVQLSAGASAFQLFDSWAGYLNRRDYDDHVLEHSTAVFDALAGHDVPSIHFGVQTGELLGSMSRAGSTAMGVDFRVALTDAATRIQPGQALQGNLDPALLFAPWEALAPRIGEIVRAGLSHDAGFVFNLGHGVLPDTDPEVPGRVVAEVHRVSAEILGEAAATR
ncbi:MULTISPECIES: uroporphyrinogen decarboxylase [Brevibacterium]|uniref:Uroporphyrinogen decarboxylase n=1 Tax=Brevibacterium casei CIP 102111 TaxID=1255625 RepID=A0A2H1I5K3_9MICO|nr:uroporphyrinogen decarboxylase [Brevibacterium casei]NJE68188.1 uroporphyrinogen decarboxylase [Brevibacterium sp. LS14]MBE4696082.1 uroporphyrinogen decarboxylase [Brevibacterium casei]MBY3579204.1 uroporphyrinogen decarboxylase [Brevibacterium casei]MCT1448151.1 uroporphyrinogen decarboxylase [Brevibacterium casei]MCT1550355.1 uroporphyrinogen decarboxylase [Brevibacterium casei]